MGANPAKTFEPEARWVDKRTAFFRCSCGLSMFGPPPETFDRILEESLKMAIPALDWTCSCGQTWVLAFGIRQVESHHEGDNDV